MAVEENRPVAADPSVLEELQGIRRSIDNIDAALVHLLAERFKFTQQVGRLKAVYGLPPADPQREVEQIQRLRALAEDSHLDPAFAEKFLTFVIAEVIHHHERLAGEVVDEPQETWPDGASDVTAAAPDASPPDIS
ncbi:chorismate mutase [Luethyella okanaganae]|uniref:Chorismate mutase n=1 Tax=Luethyella okanaganae TaxID=69372 RepID=A0ABW1VDB9_9MICO